MSSFFLINALPPREVSSRARLSLPPTNQLLWCIHPTRWLGDAVGHEGNGPSRIFTPQINGATRPRLGERELFLAIIIIIPVFKLITAGGTFNPMAVGVGDVVSP